MRVAFVHMNSEWNVGRGAGYIVGSILRAGYTVDFLDTMFLKESIILNKIITEAYDVVMISSMTLLFPEALKIIRYVKSKKNIPILVGGIHATAVGPELLNTYKDIDYLCIGEGETMGVEFLKNIGKAELFSVKNLAYRSDGIIHFNSVRPPEDLSTLPTFPWNLFERKAIVKKGSGMIYVTATRGCPFKCTYCCNSIYLDIYKGSYIRHRPVKDVITELKYLRDTYRPQIFYFGDEMIFSNEEYAKELFTTIHKEVRIPYGGMGRVESMTKPMAELLEKTGCKYLAMGIECGDEDFRKKVLKRNMTNDQIKIAFKLCRDHKIFTTSFNIIGYPVDYDDDLTKKTIKLNQEINPNFSQTTIFYPFVGTELYNYCKDNNLIDEKRSIDRYYDESILKGKKVLEKKEKMNTLLNSGKSKFRLEEPK